MPDRYPGEPEAARNPDAQLRSLGLLTVGLIVVAIWAALSDLPLLAFVVAVSVVGFMPPAWYFLRYSADRTRPVGSVLRLMNDWLWAAIAVVVSAGLGFVGAPPVAVVTPILIVGACIALRRLGLRWPVLSWHSLLGDLERDAAGDIVMREQWQRAIFVSRHRTIVLVEQTSRGVYVLRERRRWRVRTLLRAASRADVDAILGSNGLRFLRPTPPERARLLKLFW